MMAGMRENTGRAQTIRDLIAVARQNKTTPSLLFLQLGFDSAQQDVPGSAERAGDILKS